MPLAPVVLDDTALRALNIASTDVVDCIEAAVHAHANGDLITTPKSIIQPGDGRYMMTTLATGGQPDVTVVKAVTVCPGNPSLGLPSITGAIMVLDALTGECRALMDAEWITAVRTAGLSGVAARRLAEPTSEVMGFVGCGVQARSHLDLFADLFPLKAIRLLGRGQANIELLCEQANDLGLEAKVCTTPEEVLSDTDIVVSSIPLTYDGAPFLDAHVMKPTAFAVVTDAAKPWTVDGRNAFGTVVVDDMAQELSMPEPVMPKSRIARDLTGLLQDDIEISQGPRAFMFRGMALGDHALAAMVWSIFSS